MSETATVDLSDGTVCILFVDSEDWKRKPTLILEKNGTAISISGENSVYKLLSMLTSMPWGEQPLIDVESGECYAARLKGLVVDAI